jgi:hypothetical protein
MLRLADRLVSCSRCRREIAPRGQHALLYCPNCGQRLSPRGGVRHEFRPATHPTRAATWAFVLGWLGFVPGVGVPLGVAAVLVGVSARRRIAAAGGELGGFGLATIGLALGVCATVFQTLVCLGVR